MTRYEQLEEDCAARLSTLAAAGTAVQVMPQTVAEFEKPPIDRPSIIVSYIGSDYDVNDGLPQMVATDAVIQKEWAKIELTLRARALRGPGGIHELREKSQLRLLGYKLPGWSKLKLRTFTYFSFLESVWCYKMVFVCDTLAVETPDELPEVLTTEITVDEITVTT